MQTWRVELIAGWKNFADEKIQRGIFQGDALSPLLFVIAMMPLNHILRKCSAGYKLSKSQEKINPMDDIKLFVKNEKEFGTLIQTVRVYSQDIGIEFGIEKWAMLKMKNGKRRITEGVELLNQKNQNTRRKRNIRILGNIGSRHNQTNRNERKKLKTRISGERESYSRQNYIAKALSKG